MNVLTKIGIGIFAIIIAFSMVSQCNRKSIAPPPPSADVILKEYAKGLDLNAVTVLAKKAKDAADFEQLLNSRAEAVNNIDLNDDEKVDYIKVTEYGSGERKGFSLTTEISPGKTQEIATIEFSREGDKGTVQTTGNPSLYGPGQYHHSSFGLTDFLLLNWLFSNRPSYTSPYGYGHYPTSYGGGWNRQDDSTYTGSMRTRTAGSTVRTSAQPVISNPATSPNADKVAAKAKVLANPTQSQRSFGSAASTSRTSASSSSRSGGFGGFGRSSSSGSSRSGGSFGGGK
ncbi:MAG: hypothetical protein V4640_08045 [Verrucomicrobiota bacterium]